MFLSLFSFNSLVTTLIISCDVWTNVLIHEAFDEKEANVILGIPLTRLDMVTYSYGITQTMGNMGFEMDIGLPWS